MKYLFLLGLLFSSGIVYGAPSVKEAGYLYPKYPGVWQTDVVYRSSEVCNGQFNMIISTRATQLSHINKPFSGPTGSWFSVYDANTTTASASNARVIGTSYTLSTAGYETFWFKVGTSSGLIISVELNGRTPVPCLDIFEFER